MLVKKKMLFYIYIVFKNILKNREQRTMKNQKDLEMDVMVMVLQWHLMHQLYPISNQVSHL